MAETVAIAPQARIRAGFLGTTLFAIAWRNLWRNKRRTWLMAGAIAFASFLVIFGHSFQVGVFDAMIDNSTRFFLGYAQIQHPRYQDDPRMRYTVTDAAAVLAAITREPGIRAAAPRGQSFALVSVGERSFGAAVFGIDPVREFATLRDSVAVGRYVEGPGEAFVGEILARNLGASVGDELIVLGTGKDGGVAALATTIVGTFASGMADIDRSQVHVDLSEFQDAFGLTDEVHTIALLLDDRREAEAYVARLGDRFEGHRLIAWDDLLPEVKQMMELKFVSSKMLYALLVVLVTFSIVNACIMTVFERTREFGMLLALGMRSGAIVRMLLVEAGWMSVLGVALGVAIAGAIIGVLSQTGISLGDAYDTMTAQYHMPDRLRPAFSVTATLGMTATMLVATLIASALPALRLRRLNVVDALSAEE